MFWAQGGQATMKFHDSVLHCIPNLFASSRKLSSTLSVDVNPIFLKKKNELHFMLERPSYRKRTASKITKAVLLRFPIKTSYPPATRAYELCQYRSGQAPDTSSPYPEWNARAVSAAYMDRRHFSNTE